MAKINKVGFTDRLKNFILDTLSGNFDETKKFQKRLQSAIRFIITAAKKFLDDEVLLRSASISYAIVVSFVPTLVVIMMVGARFINIEEYFEQINDMARLGGMQVDLEPYFNVIRNLLKNAGAIGGIGLLVLMFSATSVLRNVDDAINRIWRVIRKRPMVQKIGGFMMVVIFGPIVLTIGISSAQWLVKQFASPNLVQVKIIKDTVQILGDQHMLLVQNEKGKPFREKNILGAVDLLVNNEAIVFSAKHNEIIPAERREVYEHARNVQPKELRDSTFVDYARVNNRELIITGNGILLTSLDNGKTFYTKKFYRQRRDHAVEVGFTRLYVLSDQNIVIIGTEGLILLSKDAGRTWRPNFQESATKHLRQMARLPNGSWLLVGDHAALVTTDNGLTFNDYQPVLAQLQIQKVSLTGIAVSPKAGYIVGEAGLLLVTRDGGLSWKSVPIAQTMFFEAVAVATDGTAVAVGYDGLIRYSQFLPDGSMQWLSAATNTSEVLRAVQFYPKENRFIIVGDNYQMVSQQMSNDKLHAREFTVIQKAPFWRRLISALGNIVIPFMVIFFLFFLIYKIIPYTKVSAKAAASGAVITSIAWVIFLILYKYYVTHFSKGTAALYGTLALVPLTLLMLYISSLIMLFGAELAFFVQYPHLLRLSTKKTDDERHKRQLWYGISMLNRLAQSFNTGKVDCSTGALVEHCNGDQEEFMFIIERLKTRGYVTQADGQLWLLAMNPDRIQISTLVEDLDPSDYSIPNFSPKNPFMVSVKKHFDKLEENRGKVFRSITLSQLMNKI
ncbi:MAG TPA: YhjD/YihY/BrkB family envelope integrity protein [Turneriella sp.]|nr:YhjD/YihY/BrkB family envelope integrity protein [Turneriella sp.]